MAHASCLKGKTGEFNDASIGNEQARSGHLHFRHFRFLEEWCWSPSSGANGSKWCHHKCSWLCTPRPSPCLLMKWKMVSICLGAGQKVGTVVSYMFDQLFVCTSHQHRPARPAPSWSWPHLDRRRRIRFRMSIHLWTTNWKWSIQTMLHARGEQLTKIQLSWPVSIGQVAKLGAELDRFICFGFYNVHFTSKLKPSLASQR